MLLTVDELTQIYTLLQEYPETTDIFVYDSSDSEDSLLLTVEFKENKETLGTVRIGNKE